MCHCVARLDVGVSGLYCYTQRYAVACSNCNMCHCVTGLTGCWCQWLIVLHTETHCDMWCVVIVTCVIVSQG